MNTITMLGTGNATVTQCYNTCFALQTDTTLLLVDGGGGNGVLRQLKKAGIGIADIHHLFVTHAHTDHILGVIWIIRMVAQCKDYEGQFHVYGNDKVQLVIRTIIDMILAKKQLAKVTERVVFHELHNGDTFEVGNIHMQCFDIYSTKEKQYGFRAELPGTTVVCLGDEPYNSQNRQLVEHADWLLCEAFCLYADREEFKPYEKSHSTARDAGKLATELGVKTCCSITPRRRLLPHAARPIHAKQHNTSRAASLCPTTWKKFCCKPSVAEVSGLRNTQQDKHYTYLYKRIRHVSYK